MNKQNQFVEWLLGEDVAFPFGKDWPQVPQVELPDTSWQSKVEEIEEAKLTGN